LEKYYSYFQNELQVELPSHSGNLVNLKAVANDLRKRLMSIFVRNSEGKRPLNGKVELFNQDKYFKDLILFYECFHGDNGRGVGASHQTGWTGIIAEVFRKLES